MCIRDSVTCWACAAQIDRGLEKAHIEPHRTGGSSTADNFLLLCHECHRAHPDDMPRAAQVAWLKVREKEVNTFPRRCRELERALVELCPSQRRRDRLIRDLVAEAKAQGLEALGIRDPWDFVSLFANRLGAVATSPRVKPAARG